MLLVFLYGVGGVSLYYLVVIPYLRIVDGLGAELLYLYHEEEG